MEEEQEHGDFYSFVGEAVGVTLAVTLEQAVGTHLAQVVAELVQSVAFRTGQRW